MTFGELIESSGLLANLSAVTRKIIHEDNVSADEYGRTKLGILPTCHTCTAPKGCCKISNLIYLYEAVPVAARLRREGRDTPELRAELRSAAEQMETTPRRKYQRPCVLLDADERCTVYEDRPSNCGVAMAYSDPVNCSSFDPNVHVTQFDAQLQKQIPPRIEQQFCADVGLRRQDHPYLGALPRMVLLALEAWDRTDYVEFLAEHGRPAAFKLARMITTE